jgi:hypothetical protein
MDIGKYTNYFRSERNLAGRCKGLLSIKDTICKTNNIV